jgi:integrase
MSDEVQFRLFLLQEQRGKKRIRSQATTKVHLELLKRLQRYVPSLDPVRITEHLLCLSDAGRKGNYLNSYIDTLKVYGRFKQTDIYNSLKYFPEDPFEKATMSDEEIEKFLSLPPPVVTRRDARTGKQISYSIGSKRWIVKTLFWKCLAYSGCRPGEIAGLTISDVRFGEQVYMVTGKTGKRFVPIAKHLVPELQEYIKTLDGEFLFPSANNGVYRQGAVINDVDWGYDFHQRIKRLGIKRKNLTPYSLRHSFITRLLNEDINLYKVQNLVGHKQGSPITSEYYHLTTKALIKTLSQDPLSLKHLSYNERFLYFRDIVRKALSELSQDVTEEQKLLDDLLRGLT